MRRSALTGRELAACGFFSRSTRTLRMHWHLESRTSLSRHGLFHLNDNRAKHHHGRNQWKQQHVGVKWRKAAKSRCVVYCILFVLSTEETKPKKRVAASNPNHKKTYYFNTISTKNIFVNDYWWPHLVTFQTMLNLSTFDPFSPDSSSGQRWYCTLHVHYKI